MKRIMIITANYTGHGHRSISDAITEQLQKHDDVEVLVIDGFSLIGRAGVGASKLYGPFTRRARELWKLTFALSNRQPAGMEEMISALIHTRLMRRLRAFNPDAIVTVHSMFNGSVLNILEKHNLDIPFIVCQADIINIHASWCDPRATVTICPTREAVDASVRHGMPRDRLELIGFPTRTRFCDAARTARSGDYAGDRPLRCLMMSGGDGGSDMLAYALNLLTETNCHLDLICGRDKKGRTRLENALFPQYAERARVYGFVDDVEKHMLTTDLLIARGSPNTLMEAVVMNVPIMIIGSLPGQEADNPALMVAHNLAVTCDSPSAAPMLVNTLTRDGGGRLREIRAAQRQYCDPDNARHIAQRIYDIARPLDRPFPPVGSVSFEEARRKIAEFYNDLK